MLSDAIQAHIQNMPDLLASKNDQGVMKSFLIECKTYSYFPDLEQKSYDLYWDYRNVIWTDIIRDDIVELLRDDEDKYYSVLFEGMNPDEVFDDCRTFESLYIEWKRYKLKFGENIKVEAFNCFLKHFSHFDSDIPEWSVCRLGFSIPIKVPMVFYMVILNNMSKYTDKSLKKYKSFLETYKKNEINKVKSEFIDDLINIYDDMINGKVEIPNVFINYNLFPFWIPANSYLLNSYHKEYFNQFDKSYEDIKENFFKYTVNSNMI